MTIETIFSNVLGTFGNYTALLKTFWAAGVATLLLGPLFARLTGLGRARLLARTWRHWLQVSTLCSVALFTTGIPFFLVEDPNIAVGWSAFLFTIWSVVVGTRFGVPPTSKIYFIGKARTRFTENVAAAFSQRVRSYPGNVALKEFFPPDAREEDGHWQVEVLRSPELLRADGIAIVLAEPNEPLKEAIALLMANSVPVVLIDHKIENRFFDVRGAQRPKFVTSNFFEGGTMIGRAMASAIKDDGDLAVFLIGPMSSTPAILRCQAALLAFISETRQGRVLGISIPSWREADVYQKLRAVLPEPTSQKRVLIFAANDTLLEYLDRALVRDYPTAELLLFGYDGVQDYRDQYVIKATVNGACTIDVRPRTQGECAADVLLTDIQFPRNHSPKNYVVAPQVVAGSKAYGLSTNIQA